MLQSEVSTMLAFWTDGASKIFRYTDHEFIRNEFIKIVKYYGHDSRQEYLVDGSSTRFPLGKTKLTPEEMEKLLVSDQLVEYSSWTVDTPRQLKTGSCECGAYVLDNNEMLHSKWCPKHKRDPGEWT